MSDSGIDDSDSSAIYDLNSDDEPPSDECFVPVIASRDGLVVKRILRVGQGVNKPGYGDEVLVRCQRLSTPDFESAATPTGEVSAPVDSVPLAKRLLSRIAAVVPGQLEDPEDHEVNNETATASSNPGNLPSDASPAPKDIDFRLPLSALAEQMLLETNSTISLLGSTGGFCLGVSQALRTMKSEELSIICFPKNSVHSKMESTAALPREAKYEIAHTKEIKARSRALRRLQRNKRTEGLRPTATPGQSRNEHSPGTLVNSTSRPIFKDSTTTAPGSTNTGDTSGDTCFPSSHDIYLVELLSFNTSLVLTNDQGVVKRPIKTVAPCFPSPREGDTVTYFWEVLEVQEYLSTGTEGAVAVDCRNQFIVHQVETKNAPITTQETHGGLGLDSQKITAGSLSSASALLAKIKVSDGWQTDNVLEKGAVPIPGIFQILLSMRLGDECLGILTGKYGNPSRVLATTIQQNDEKDNFGLELDKLRLTVRVVLSACLRKDTILLPNIRRLPNLLPPLDLHFHEKILNTIGPKQQLVIEPGCRVLAYLTLTRPNPDGSTSSIFPFRPVLSGKNGTIDGQAAKDGFVAFTVGLSTVPEWLDVIAMKMRVGQRLGVDIVPRIFEDSTAFEALRTSLLLRKNEMPSQFDAIKNPLPVLEFLKIQIHELGDSIPNEARSAAPECSKDETHPCAGSFHVTDRAGEAIQGVESYLEAWTLGRWKATSPLCSDVVALREVIDTRFCLGEWDQNGCKRFVEEWRTDLGSMQLDIQVVDVVQRISEPWMLTETQRILTALEFNGFANMLLREDLIPLAHRYYDYALNVIRFCHEVEGVMQNMKSDDVAYGSVTVAARRAEPAPVQDFEHTESPTAAQPPCSRSPVEFLRAIHSNKAQCYLLESKWREAIQSCRSAIKFGADDVKTYYRLAKANLELDKIDECCQVITTYNKKGRPPVAALDDLMAKVKMIERKTRARERQMYRGMF